MLDINALPEHDLRIETARFGPFTFQAGVDTSAIATSLVRVEDAHARFVSSPLAQVANQLAREVLVSSVFGTNAIEGGELTEEETAAALTLDPAQVQAEQQRRVVNIRLAYELAQREAGRDGWQLTEAFIRAVHHTISQGLDEARYRPDEYRDNPKDRPTVVGDPAHGGRYKPPQYGGDVRRLLSALVDWHHGLAEAEISPLLRAPLVHLYFELIHPFWDGNGRVGRVLEAAILHAAGFRYAPFALARYCLEHIDRYFTLFNLCRKQADKGEAYPNTPFVLFHLEGMREVIDSLHDRVNRLVNVLLFQADIRDHFERKALNPRQYAIVTQVLAAGGPVPVEVLRTAPWYQALYVKRTDKTKQRDLKGLREQGLLKLDRQGRLWPGFVTLKGNSLD